jgi:hypothetical protein
VYLFDWESDNSGLSSNFGSRRSLTPIVQAVEFLVVSGHFSNRDESGTTHNSFLSE